MPQAVTAHCLRQALLKSQRASAASSGGRGCDREEFQKRLLAARDTFDSVKAQLAGSLAPQASFRAATCQLQHTWVET